MEYCARFLESDGEAMCQGKENRKTWGIINPSSVPNLCLREPVCLYPHAGRSTMQSWWEHAKKKHEKAYARKEGKAISDRGPGSGFDKWNGMSVGWISSKAFLIYADELKPTLCRYLWIMWYLCNLYLAFSFLDLWSNCLVAWTFFIIGTSDGMHLMRAWIKGPWIVTPTYHMSGETG